MTRLDATHFTATLAAAKPATLAYKYTVNANWSNNEETSGCAYVGNRSMSVNGSSVNDTVANW
jgi:hypothetical protein